MKHIRCSKCCDLVRASDYCDHYRNCETRNEDSDVHVPEVCEDSESTSKRQKMSGTITERKENADSDEENGYTICSKCMKRFSTSWYCRQHEASCKGPKLKKTAVTTCGKCRKQFSDYHTRMRHEKNCERTKTCKVSSFQCTSCKERFQTLSELMKHEKLSSHNQPGGSGLSTFNSTSNNNNNATSSETKSHHPSCRSCGDRFANYRDLYHHRMIRHKQTGSEHSHSDPWMNTGEIPPWINEDGSENMNMKNAYDQHKHLILRERVMDGQVRDTYNFPVPNLSNVDQLISHLEFIFERSQHAFKVNLSFGIILQNIDNHGYRYFAPHYTDSFFLFPQLISNNQDINRIRLRLAELDLSTYFQKQKPNSKWKPVLITNVLYVVHKTSFPLGLGRPLPQYITNSKSIISFEKNHSTGKMYTDNRCFFRCLAYHKSKRNKCENLTAELYSQWLNFRTCSAYFYDTLSNERNNDYPYTFYQCCDSFRMI